MTRARFDSEGTAIQTGKWRTRRSDTPGLFAAVILLLLAGFTWAVGTGRAQSSDPNQDSLLKEPYVDVDEWRDTPVRHRYVHGGFKGTEARFSIYLPPKEQYKGKFFQHITPTPASENEGTKGTGAENKVGMSISSGAYFVETNEGGMASLGKDSTLAAYRVNAAAARYSRVVAAQMYGPHRTCDHSVS